MIPAGIVGVMRRLLMGFLPLATAGCCLFLLGSPCEILDPKTPQLVLKLRHVSVETKQEVDPLFIGVYVKRWYGRRAHGFKLRGIDTVLARIHTSDNTVRLPHYIPAPGEDGTLYLYTISIVQFMADTYEAVSYEIRGNLLIGEDAPDDGRTRFPIQPDGSIQITVPFARKAVDFPEPAEPQRLFRLVENLTNDPIWDIPSLPPRDQVRLADWALARLDELERKLGRTEAIQKMQQRWADVQHGAAR